MGIFQSKVQGGDSGRAFDSEHFRRKRRCVSHYVDLATGCKCRIMSSRNRFRNISSINTSLVIDYEELAAEQMTQNETTLELLYPNSNNSSIMIHCTVLNGLVRTLVTKCFREAIIQRIIRHVTSRSKNYSDSVRSVVL